MFRSPDEKITATCITLTPELRQRAKNLAEFEREQDARKRDHFWRETVMEARALLRASIEEATSVLSA